MALVLGACRPLRHEPWALSRPGSLGVLARAGVWSDYEAEGTFTFDANFGDPLVQLTTALDGEYGGVLGLEYFVLRDVSLLVGYDRRRFDPRPTQGLLIDDVESEEVFLAARYLLPWRFTSGDRLRCFVEGKLGYVPGTQFTLEFDADLPGFANPRFDFDGSSYFNVGLSGGLLYQLTDALVGQLSLIYEWPLSATEDLVQFDFLGFPIALDSTIESRGAIALVGITWYF